jgi:hypothetical protein
MIDLKTIRLTFTVLVNEANINILKRLFNDTSLLQVNNENEITIGEEIDLHFSFEGELETELVAMVMLFNGSLVGKPKLSLLRE